MFILILYIAISVLGKTHYYIAVEVGLTRHQNTIGIRVTVRGKVIAIKQQSVGLHLHQKATGVSKKRQKSNQSKIGAMKVEDTEAVMLAIVHGNEQLVKSALRM